MKENKFGERLKEERARLGLSQSAFAQCLEIHRNTQIKYESGERYPDSNYLHAAQELGVDVYFLHSGVREEARDYYDIARADLAEGMYAALGFENNEVRASILELSKLVAAEFEPGGGCCEDVWKSVILPRFVSTFLSNSPVLSSENEARDTPSVDLLASVLEGLEDELGAQCQVWSPSKKAQAVAMLYRAFKASSKVDPAMIEETVKLAAG